MRHPIPLCTTQVALSPLCLVKAGWRARVCAGATLAVGNALGVSSKLETRLPFKDTRTHCALARSGDSTTPLVLFERFGVLLRLSAASGALPLLRTSLGQRRGCWPHAVCRELLVYWLACVGTPQPQRVAVCASLYRVLRCFRVTRLRSSCAPSS